MRYLATSGARRRRLLAAGITTLAALATPTAARAAFLVNVSDAAPASTAASAYSDFTLAVAFPQDSTPRDLDIDLPQGQLGVLDSAAECPAATFRADACTDASRIGGVSVVVHTTVLGNITAPGSIYRIPATGTEVGRIGIAVRPPVGDKMFLEGTLRVRDDGTYGIRASVRDMPKQATLSVPPLGSIPLDITVESMRMVMYGRVGQTGPKGFFFNPAECVTATSVVSAVAWDGQRAAGSASYTPTDCAGVPFEPSLSFSPSPSAAATPVPFTVKVSQPFDPTAAKIGAPIRETRLVLPEGVQLTGASNSDGALAACSDAQFHLEDLLPATCPAGSKVGTVVLDSPLVGPVNGDVFLAQPASGPNDLIRLFIVAQRGPQSDALRVKLLTRVEGDPATGRLVNTLVDLPAQPVNSLTLRFRDGSAPGIRQPRTCGEYSGSAALVPFSSATAVNRTGGYTVNANCPAAGRFRPTAAMTLSPTGAGVTSTGTTSFDLPIGDEPWQSITTSLPPGLLANIAGVPRCTLAQAGGGTCPAPTRVGSVTSLAGQSTTPGSFSGTVSLTDAPDAQSIAGLFIKVPVLVGPIFVGDVTSLASIRLRPDYGIDVIAPVPVTIRGIALDQQQLRLVLDRPGFMVNPPTCSGNAIRAELTSAQGTRASATSPITVTGCDRLAFAPKVGFSASSAAPGEPSSLTTTVEFPASTDGAPQRPAGAITVRLPEGVSLSASAGAAGDLAGCSDAQFDAQRLTPPSCPARSAIGTVSIDTPSVGRLTGTAYLGDATGDHLARMLLDARADQFGPGVRVKVVGTVDVDPQTGQTTATFSDLPPVAFTRFALTTRGGGAPVIALPRTCGTFAGGATFSPLGGGDPVDRDASLTLDAGCPADGTFAPQVAVATGSTQAGADTSLTTTLTTDPAGQELRSLDMTMPAGLLGRLTAAAQCPLEAARENRCGDDALVGTVEAQAGVRGAPFTVTGRVYLTAGAGDAIAGLAFALPAKVGPIDLGTVVTLAELRLTPGDLRLRITASDIPTQVRGVRLDLQRLAISIDRLGLVVNPTSCAGGAGTALLGSAQGASLEASFGYQATGCEALAWRPTLAVAFSGTAADLATKGHPTITTVIEMPRGQGNLRTAVVDLPDGVSTDLNSINARVCESAAAAAAGACPAASQIGNGQIVTSALAQPVAAGIFLVKVPGQVLPGIALRIRDQISFDLVGTTRITAQGRLRVTFDGSPDAPIDRLSLTFVGGAGGVVQLGSEICGVATAATDATLTSQSGAAAVVKVPVDCGNRPQAQRGSASAKLSLRLRGRSRGATLVVRASAGVRAVTLKLPSGLALQRRQARAVRVTKAGGKRTKASVRISGSTLTVKVSAKGITRLQIVVPPKATKFRASYVRGLRSSPAQKRVRPRLSVKDGAGQTLSPKPVVRFAAVG